MATQIVKRKNFKAPLPDDFYMLKSLTKLKTGEITVVSNPLTLNYGYDIERFCINKDHFYFSGYWSRNPVKRIFQKITERIWPIKYKVEYLSITEVNKK